MSLTVQLLGKRRTALTIPLLKAGKHNSKKADAVSAFPFVFRGNILQEILDEAEKT